MRKRVAVIAFSCFSALAVLALVELVLRMADLGAPADDPYLDIAGNVKVFVKTDGYYETRPNRRKLFRYQKFEIKKREGVKRIFCLGGSVVYGFPYSAQGAFPYFLNYALNTANSGGEVINAGGIAYASYRVLKVLSEVLEYRPDAVVIMSGHNEFLEKRVYAKQLATHSTVKKLRLFLSKFHIFNLLRHAIEQQPSPGKALLGENVSWDFVPRDEKQKKLTEEHYQYTLHKMLELARRKDVPIIFVTLPCNLKDYPPLGGDASDEAHRLYAQATALLREGKRKEAYTLFRKSADLDEHPIRVLSRYNEIIREVSMEKGAYLADAELVFRSLGDGIPGNEFFLDHVHLKSEGAELVASVVAEALVKAGLVRNEQLAIVFDGIHKARIQLGDQEEAKARYGAAYEAFRYLHKNGLAQQLLHEALEIDPTFTESQILLNEILSPRVPIP